MMRRILKIVTSIISVFAACYLSYQAGARSVVCPEPVVCPEGINAVDAPVSAPPVADAVVSAPEVK